MKWWITAGMLLGAVPAAVMECIEPYWGPSALTAFAMPMLALGMIGFLVKMVKDDLRGRIET